MTTHRVRLYHSTDGAQTYHDWLDQWLLNMGPWDYDGVENTLPTETEPLRDDADPYFAGELAFDWSEDRAIILDQLAQYADAYCSWVRIGYHECDHDADDPTPCAWDETREGGTVPDYVPDFEVDA